MKLVHDIPELRTTLRHWRGAGETIAFVPTMGNLHRGHLELVREARRRAARVVVSVFVNPLQFGPTEDFGRYPRTLEADQSALATQGQADLLFAPSAAAIYPRGMEGLTRVRVPGLENILCGAFRPGHFEGVATVVNLLFNLVQPDLALFGEKDYQQLLVIRRMVTDLHLPVEIVGVPTQREADGLALSSRNQYLQDAERRQAVQLYATLTRMATELRGGRRDFAALEQEALTRLREAGFTPQYFEIRAPDLSPPVAGADELVLLAAAQIGSTRLIDNLRVALREP